MTSQKNCSPMDYRIEAIVTIDERGQMVLPKSIRQRAGVAPGDRLAVAIGERDGKVCCLHLIKVQELDKRVGEIVNEVE